MLAFDFLADHFLFLVGAGASAFDCLDLDGGDGGGDGATVGGSFLPLVAPLLENGVEKLNLDDDTAADDAAAAGGAGLIWGLGLSAAVLVFSPPPPPPFPKLNFIAISRDVVFQLVRLFRWMNGALAEIYNNDNNSNNSSSLRRR